MDNLTQLNAMHAAAESASDAYDLIGDLVNVLGKVAAGFEDPEHRKALVDAICQDIRDWTEEFRGMRDKGACDDPTCQVHGTRH